MFIHRNLFLWGVMAALICLPARVDGAGSVFGYVRSTADSAAIPNATVMIDDTTNQTLTNEFGFFTINGLQADNHIIEIKADGYMFYSFGFDLMENEHWEINAFLTEKTIPITVSQFRRNFSIRLTGGIAYWQMTDWNQFYKSGTANLVTLPFQYNGIENLEGSKIHWIFINDVELRYSLHPRFSLGLGIEHGSKTGRIEYDAFENLKGGGFKDTGYDRIESITARAVPINFLVYVNSISHQFVRSFGFGFSWLYSSLRHQYKFISAESSEIYDSAFSKWEFSPVASLEVGYDLNQRISVFGQLFGRSSSISGYIGKLKKTINGTESNSDNIRFYSLHYNGLSDEWNDLVIQFLAWPAHQGVPPPLPGESENPILHQWRETVMHFSGISLKFGLEYHF